MTVRQLVTVGQPARLPHVCSAVIYHGTLTEAHGHATLLKACECYLCGFDSTGRVVLAVRREGGERHLEHVGPSSWTCTSFDCPRRQH